MLSFFTRRNSMKIAFAGNPNSGKTTMYNALTGSNEHVGNWAGVTVDKKESYIKKAYSGGKELIAVDLPGAYSMSPFTAEESVTRDYIQNEHVDVIVNIVDATNLSRSLFFTTQLLELGIPVVVALNKTDINQKKNTVIDTMALSWRLSCPVIETISTDSDSSDLAEVIRTAVSLAGKQQIAPCSQGDVDMTSKEAVTEADRKRFAFVNGIVSEVERRKVFTRDHNYQDKIDSVLTSPIAGLPIFAFVMFLVFDISQSTFGPWVADVLAGWIEGFQAWAGELFANAHPLLYALLIDGIIGGVGAVVGFLPLVMVMYFPHRAAGGLWLHGPGHCCSGSHFQAGWSFRQIRNSLCGWYRLCHPRRYGLSYDPGSAGAPGYRHAGPLHALRRQAAGHRPVRRRLH